MTDLESQMLGDIGRQIAAISMVLGFIGNPLAVVQTDPAVFQQVYEDMLALQRQLMATHDQLLASLMAS